jgi:hypothetical protein
MEKKFDDGLEAHAQELAKHTREIGNIYDRIAQEAAIAAAAADANSQEIGGLREFIEQ